MLATTACVGSVREVHAPFYDSVVTGPSPSITLSNAVGEVRIEPSAANTVNVAATKYAAYPEQLRNIEIAVRRIGSGVFIKTVYRASHEGGVRYDVAVPRNASVRITNIMGTIDVGAIAGSVVAHTSTGAIGARLGTRCGAPFRRTANEHRDHRAANGRR